MRRCVRFASPAALLVFVLLNAGNAADWPSFRGLQFGESPEKDLPSKLSEKDKFQTLARLEFPERDGVFNGSPAAGNGRLYVRSNAYLYCIGNMKPE